jgi:hypothetical protein
MCISRPEDRRSLLKWELEFWRLTKELLDYVHDSMAKTQKFVVQVNKMDEQHCVVPLHTDRWNLSPQYHITFGEFEGATLKSYNWKERKFESFSRRDRVLKFDGRLPHYVEVNNFSGTRYSLTYYVCQQDNIEEIMCCPKYMSF